MATVKDLIGQLEKIEDKNQSVIFQYYLAEHFDFFDKGSPTAEQFDQATDELDDENLWDDAGETINDYLYSLMDDEEEDETDEN